MLAVPVLEDRNLIKESDVLPGQLNGGSPCLVRCPIVRELLIDEGLCYDIQAFALGRGTEYWRTLAAEEFTSTLSASVEQIRRVCLGHQLELIKQGRSDTDFSGEVQIQLNSIHGDK